MYSVLFELVLFQVESIEWAYENIGEITSKGQLNNMADFLAHKQLDLVINLPMRHGGARRVSSFSTHGIFKYIYNMFNSMSHLRNWKWAYFLIIITTAVLFPHY